MNHALTVVWIGILLGLQVVPAHSSTPGAGSPSELADAVHAWGEELWEVYAPEEWKAEYAFPPQEDWNQFWIQVEQSLGGGSLEELAWMVPEVEAALSNLEAVPALEPYADWLRQRADYFRMAEHVIQVFAPQTPRRPARGPGKTAPSRPPSQARPRNPPPPRAQPPPPPLARKRKAAVRNTTVWKQKLSRRRPPARAESMIPGLKQIFLEEGVAPEWVWLAEVESSLNPKAKSPVGAAGLFQFMPATAEAFGMKTHPVDERLIPEKSARAAAQYLRMLYGRFASWPLALAAYNAGQGRVGRTLKAANATTFDEIVERLPAETQMYVPKVLATVSIREGVTAENLPPPSRRTGYGAGPEYAVEARGMFTAPGMRSTLRPFTTNIRGKRGLVARLYPSFMF